MLTGPLFPEITLDLLLKDAVVDILLKIINDLNVTQNKFSLWIYLNITASQG